MPSLRELQQAFGQGLLSAGAACIAPFVVPNGIDPGARVQIYRNNVREGFLATLRAGYPVLERLVGQQYFRQLTFEYHARFPSPSGNLHHAGQRLPEFLAEKFASTEYVYFHDVSRLEWSVQEVLVAAGADRLNIARLEAVTAGDYARLVFRLHPATALVSSEFPILSIWQANQPEADERVIDLDSGAEHVLLFRTDDAVELRRLTRQEHAFLVSIDAGNTLEEVMEDTLAEGDMFDAAAGLRRYVAAGAIVDFEFENGDGA